MPRFVAGYNKSDLPLGNDAVTNCNLQYINR